jgi:hypothetical protein
MHSSLFEQFSCKSGRLRYYVVSHFLTRDGYMICGGFLRNLNNAQFAVDVNFKKLRFFYLHKPMGVSTPHATNSPGYFQQYSNAAHTMLNLTLALA